MKRVNGCTIHLQKGERTYLGRYHTGSKRIYYNLKMIEKWKKAHDMSFDELLIGVISHEYIHKLLDLTEGEDACIAWDKISHNNISGCV